MKIKSFEFNLFGEHTYIVWNEAALEGAVIDPGMSNETENRRFAGFIESNRISIRYLLYTHLHIDHTFGHEFIKKTYGVPAMAHEADAELGLSRRSQAEMFHLRVPTPEPLVIDEPLTENHRLALGDEGLTVIRVPGHTQGSVAYYCPTSHFVVTGDALFQGSIGRTDLPGGDHSQLIRSIQTRLLSLPPETEVYPGHGPSTTIGREIRYNPFI